MNTIFIPVYPKPSGANVTRLDVDFNEFDPHNGIKFSVVLKNPQDLTLDRVYTCMYGDDWQNWPSEQTAQADYKYVKKVVLDNLGYTEAIAPFFVIQPQDLNINLGQQALFTTLVSGDLPISYQWTKNSTQISGAINNNYEIVSVSETDFASYAVTASNAVGSISSSSVVLKINKAPTISYQPQNVSGYIGEKTFFNVAAQGDPSPSYQWAKDGVEISGANFSVYNINSLKDSDAGIYTVNVSNIVASVLSNSAELQVGPVPEPEPPAPEPPPESKP